MRQKGDNRDQYKTDLSYVSKLCKLPLFKQFFRVSRRTHFCFASEYWSHIFIRTFLAIQSLSFACMNMLLWEWCHLLICDWWISHFTADLVIIDLAIIDLVIIDLVIAQEHSQTNWLKDLYLILLEAFKLITREGGKINMKSGFILWSLWSFFWIPLPCCRWLVFLMLVRQLHLW